MELPIVYLCENNQYGLSTSMAESTAIDRIARRADAYSMPGVTIDGNDVLAVLDAVRTAVQRARDGGGPTLIEALTYRWGEHSMRANLPAYRANIEEQQWIARDPLARLRALLTERGVDEQWFDDARARVEDELRAAEAFASASREPTFDDLRDAVTAPHADTAEPDLPSPMHSPAS